MSSVAHDPFAAVMGPGRAGIDGTYTLPALRTKDDLQPAVADLARAHDRLDPGTLWEHKRTITQWALDYFRAHDSRYTKMQQLAVALAGAFDLDASIGGTALLRTHRMVHTDEQPQQMATAHGYGYYIARQTTAKLGDAFAAATDPDVFIRLFGVGRAAELTAGAADLYMPGIAAAKSQAGWRTELSYALSDRASDPSPAECLYQHLRPVLIGD